MFNVKRRSKKFFSLAMIVFMLVTTLIPSGLIQKVQAASTPVTVAGWSFEPDSKDATKPAYTGSSTTPYPATSGIPDNAGKAKFTISGNRTLSYTASSKTIYAGGWNSAEPGYWQTQISTVGFSQLTLSSKTYGTGTGPRDFKIQYSIDGTTFSDVEGSTFVQGLTITNAPSNLALPSQLNDQSNVYIRWVNSSAININNDGKGVASGGNSRIAEIVITGLPTDNSGEPPVTVTGVTLDKSTLSMEAGGTKSTLTAAVQPANATNKGVAWSSDNPAVASVDSNGAVTPISVGTAKITVTTADGGYKATSTITVTPATSKTAAPVASKINFPTLTTVTGLAGSVVGSSQVNIYTDASLSTKGGTTTANSDGSFNLTNLTNPQSKTTVYVTALASGQPESDSVSINLATTQSYKAGDVVFSQLYLQGGNSNAFYNTKFFELYNTTDYDINFNSQWSIAYAAATAASFGAGTKLTGTIKAHGYYLVTGQSGATGAALPVKADQATTINPSAGSTNGGGILALTNTTTALSSQDDPKAMDIVTYGNGTVASFPLKTDHWGSPFFNSSITSGTILRRTDTGSDPRVAFGLGNGFFSKDPSKDFVLNSPSVISAPEEVSIRNSSILSPDASKISFTNTSGNASVVGNAGSVPAYASVKAYIVSGDAVSLAGQAAAGTNGSFSVNFTDVNNTESIFLTYTDTVQPAPKESVYTHIDKVSNPSAVVSVAQLRKNDAKGLSLNIGYAATIEGIVTTNNQALGPENTNFYMQDATGGINVIAGQAPAVPIEVGHKVKISGKLAFTAGMLQFISDKIVDEGSAELPAAISITNLNDVNNYAVMEPLEGKLVSIKGKITNIPKEGPDYNVTITDDAGRPAIVRIVGTTGINVNTVLQLNDIVTINGIVGQSKWLSPYTSGYYIAPRSVLDFKGEIQLSHEPVTTAYIGIDTPIKAMAKYTNAMTLYYKNADESTYTSVLMTTVDSLNYFSSIPKEKAIAGAQILYYIEAKGDGQALSSGSASLPNVIQVTLDIDGPSYSNELPANGTSVESSHPVISVELDDPSGVDVDSLKISLKEQASGKITDYSNQADRSETKIRLNLTTDLAVGAYTVFVSANDKLGNHSEFVWVFEIAAKFSGGNHYRGTTHNHTEISKDAGGDPEKALTEAKKYGYDFFAFSDHSQNIDAGNIGKDSVDHNGMPERTGGSQWKQTKDLANQYTKDGSFVVFPGFEMTGSEWGHANVFGTTNFTDRAQDGGKYQSLKNFYAWTLTYDNLVAQFNHPAAGKDAFDNFIPYDKAVDNLFTLIEVGNGSGQYSYVNADKKFYNALDLGWHLAPTYGEDNHNGTWGQTKKRTVIVANDLSQESLLDAMRKMHVYLSEDPNFQLDVLSNGYYMGSTVDSNTLNFDISGKDPVLESTSDPRYSYMTTPSNDNIKKVELITNGGAVIDTYTPSGNTTSFNWKPKVTVVNGQQWFVVKVTQMDGDLIYSSPIWSQVQPFALKVTDLTILEGAAIAGIPVTLKAGISNQGTTNIQNLTTSIYYDTVDAAHLIGESTTPSLASNKSTSAEIQWPSPVAGEHKLIVKLKAEGQDIGDNKFEQVINVNAPLDLTVMIDATHKNENTTSDTGTYKDNLKTFTLNLKKQGYTVIENKTTLTAELLKDVAVLMVTHPSNEYSAAEIAIVKSFVDNGGSLLLSEKSNYGGTTQNLNSLLAGIGSSILVNNDGVFDETKEGNFWSTPLTSNYSMRLHLNPVRNGLTDFISLLDFYSGSSLTRNDGNGNKVPLTDSDKVTILARGNETSFQDAPQVKSDAVKYNVYTSNGSKGPALENVTGGSVIPLVASEELGKGRIIVAGMNIFNDLQMNQNDGPVGNQPFENKVISWLAHQEMKVTSINEVRQLPLDTKVIIEGKVTTTAFYDAAYIQDETGGVVAFSEVPAGALQLGDTVRVYGSVAVFENDVEVIFERFDNSVVKLGSGAPVEPMTVSTQASVAEENQGRLVQVKGKVTAIPDENSYVINDGTGDVLVFVDGYIMNQTGPVPAIKVGDTLQAVGLSGKYSEGNRIRVRDTKELSVTGSVSVPVTGVTLEQLKLDLKVGEAANLVATVNPANATNKSVSWLSSNPAIVTVDVNGRVLAVSAGVANVTVTTAEGGFTATSEVTVADAPPVNLPVTGVTLDKPKLTLTVNDTADLIATVNPDNATNKSVNWLSSNPAVVTVDVYGKATAVAAGAAIITVTTEEGNFQAASEITVTDVVSTVPVTSVTLDRSELTFTVGGAAQKLTATVNPDNATNKEVTWSSSNAAVATVDNQGKVTPVAAGTAIITVTTVDGGKSATSEVTVKPLPISEGSANIKVYVKQENVVWERSSSVEFNLALSNAKAVNALDVTFQYDNTKFKLKKVELVNDQDGLLQFDDKNGTVRILAGFWQTITSDNYTDVITLTLESIQAPEKQLKAEVKLINAITASSGTNIDVPSIIAEGMTAIIIHTLRDFPDVNGDGVVTLADLSKALEYYRSTSGDSNWNEAKYADINGDGVVDVTDLTMIMVYILNQ